MNKKEIIKERLSTLGACLLLGILISMGMMFLSLFMMAFGFWQWGIFSLLAEINTWTAILRFGVGGGLLGFIMISAGNHWMGKSQYEKEVIAMKEEVDAQSKQG